MMTDPIADMLTRIRNAVSVERDSVEMPTSMVKQGLADVLKREGFIWDWSAEIAEPVSQLHIVLKYGSAGEKVIRKIHTVDIAPTLSAYLGIKAPSGAFGNVLEELFD